MANRDVRIGVVQQAAKASGGTQDYPTGGLSGLGTPKALILNTYGAPTRENYPTADNAQPTIYYNMGTASATDNQRVSYGRARQSSTQTDNTGHIGWDDRVFHRTASGSNNTFSESAALSSFGTDKVTLTHTVTTPLSSLLNMMLFAGADVQVFQTKLNENGSVGAYREVAIPFMPTFGFLHTPNDQFDGQLGHLAYAPETWATFSVGSDGTITCVGQAHSFRKPSAGGATAAFGIVQNQGLITIDPTVIGGTTNYDGFFTPSFPNSSTFRLTTQQPTGDDDSGDINVTLMKFGDLRVQAFILALPTLSAGATIDGSMFTPQIPFTKQALLLGLNRLASLNTFSGDDPTGGTNGFLMAAHPKGGSFACYSASGAWRQGLAPLATSESRGFVSNRLYLPSHNTAEAPYTATLSGFVRGGFSLSAASITGTRYLPGIAIEQEDAVFESWYAPNKPRYAA